MNSAQKNILPFVLIALIGFLAYANSFKGPFIYDDVHSIVTNASIYKLWPITDVIWAPPAMGGVVGRPLVNLTLAFNYAISGLDVWSYHLFNLIFHILAAWTLFGVLRRTFLLEKVRASASELSENLALAVTLIWTVHPLQTQAVTYVIQRCESLMGLFFLLTFYCAIRGWQSPRQKLWHTLAGLSCLVGVGAKEVIAAAPLLIVLYDWLWVHGSLKEALRRSWWLWTLLALDLILLYAHIVHQGWGNLVDVDVKPAGLAATLTQGEVIWHYLRLVVWPYPLVLDYGWPIADPWSAWPYSLAILGLCLGTLWALIKRHPIGYLGAWFFLILAPTSSGLVQVEAAYEHRMYLPLVSIIIVLFFAGRRGLDLALDRLSRNQDQALRLRTALRRDLVMLVVLALGVVTVFRNLDYRYKLTFWLDNMEKRPGVARIVNSVGHSLYELGRLDEAIPYFEKSIRMQPGYVLAYVNLCSTLNLLGRTSDAEGYCRTALRLQPTLAVAHLTYADLLLISGRPKEATDYYRSAIRLAPFHGEFYSNLSVALMELGQLNEAYELLKTALRLKPNFVQAQFNMGQALLKMGRPREAIPYYQEAIKAHPDYAKAHASLGMALAQLNRPEEAVQSLKEALNLEPDFPEAHEAMAKVLRRLNRDQEAASHEQKANDRRPPGIPAIKSFEMLGLSPRSLPEVGSK